MHTRNITIVLVTAATLTACAGSHPTPAPAPPPPSGTITDGTWTAGPGGIKGGQYRIDQPPIDCHYRVVAPADKVITDATPAATGDTTAVVTLFNGWQITTSGCGTWTQVF